MDLCTLGVHRSTLMALQLLVSHSVQTIEWGPRGMGNVLVYKLLSRMTEGIFYVQTPLDQTDTKNIKQMKTMKCSLECKIHAGKMLSHCEDKFHIVII